jgi:hypothetical protein
MTENKGRNRENKNSSKIVLTPRMNERRKTKNKSWGGK